MKKLAIMALVALLLSGCICVRPVRGEDCVQGQCAQKNYSVLVATGTRAVDISVSAVVRRSTDWRHRHMQRGPVEAGPAVPPVVILPEAPMQKKTMERTMEQKRTRTRTYR